MNVRIPNDQGETGKYDDESEQLARKYKAAMCMVIMIGGEKGHGFSISAMSPTIFKEIPDVLRNVADDIERQSKQSAQ